MATVFVLLHSPAVGPGTWRPVAESLAVRGVRAVVPSLLEVGEGGPPFASRVVAAVRSHVDGLDPDDVVVLVPHSNAGVFVPLLIRDAVRPVVGCLFVDARVPERTGPSPMATPELLALLRAKAVDGVLPPWTTWWDDEELTPLLPDPVTRAAVVDEQPRLPLAYFEEKVAVPAAWDTVPCGYLLFGDTYADEARDVADRGWPVERMDGFHLHQVVDASAVADRLLVLAAALGIPGVETSADRES